MKWFFSVLLITISAVSQSHASGMCDDSERQELCYNMRHLRASINALDAQRELMQVNPGYLAALGLAMRDTADFVRRIIGIGIPEHLMGLSGVQRMGAELAAQAATNDTEMLKTANNIRNNCATCHGPTNPNGGVDWDRVFNYDWTKIAEHCSDSNRNPYLCRSMNGMLSAYGYLLTGYQAKKQDYAMTRAAADEIVRILQDIQVKGFSHLPEALRMQAESDAREISLLAHNKDESVFEKATHMTNACQQCHERRLTPYNGLQLSNWTTN